MVRPERFELPTYSSGGCRSIQLSYGRTPIFPVYMRSFALSIGFDQAPRSGFSQLSQSHDTGLSDSDFVADTRCLVAIPTAAATAMAPAPATTITTAATTAATAFDLGASFVHV